FALERIRLLSPTSFFFSSRSRHTTSKRDWSSDVCSSDLIENCLRVDIMSLIPLPVAAPREPAELAPETQPPILFRTPWCRSRPRSEERRVGEESRMRRGDTHAQKSTGVRTRI